MNQDEAAENQDEAAETNELEEKKETAFCQIIDSNVQIIDSNVVQTIDPNVSKKTSSEYNFVEANKRRVSSNFYTSINNQLGQTAVKPNPTG